MEVSSTPDMPASKRRRGWCQRQTVADHLYYLAENSFTTVQYLSKHIPIPGWVALLFSAGDENCGAYLAGGAGV